MPDVTNATLGDLLGQWRDGRTKNDIERREFSDSASHGKLITRLWRERLGVETEEVHPLVLENRRLRRLLEDAGVSADA